MAWLKKDTKLRGHPKLVACADALDLKPVYLEGHLDSIWLACLERYEDGDLSGLSNVEIAILAEYNPKNADCFVRLLQKHRWLEDHLIHDWLDYAGDYLKGKYRKSPEKLLAIYKKHGREGEIKKTVHVSTRPVHVPVMYGTSQDIDKDNNKETHTTRDPPEPSPDLVNLAFSAMRWATPESVLSAFLLDGHPEEWISEAIKRAAMAEKNNPAYVRAILQEWRKQGGPPNEKPVGGLGQHKRPRGGGGGGKGKFSGLDPWSDDGGGGAGAAV